MNRINRITKFLLGNHLKSYKLTKLTKLNKSANTIDGFTLIELLVAMIIATLVITPLLGFMINILDTDRKESAKETSEQEIQSAIDYISRDLQQAVYIYDPVAFTKTSSTTPSLSGIKNQIPPTKTAPGCSNRSECKPILVFWKREFKENVIPNQNNGNDDSFVYSLVAYYVIKDNDNTWSNATRIARFQIEDGVRPTDGSGVACSGYLNDKFVKNQCPSKGYQPFDLSLRAANIHEKMNSWTANSTAYTDKANVLVDFIDQTPISNLRNSPNKPTCPSGTLSEGGVMGFYACVDHTKTTATVFLRGNALVRLQNDASKVYNENNKTYFPTASRNIEGRGYLFNE
ncbi:MAG: hormogonium polysaccharide secretion pseudopilin HpsC [Cyanobacteria bacterium P01_A01_bin.84]